MLAHENTFHLIQPAPTSDAIGTFSTNLVLINSIPICVYGGSGISVGVDVGNISGSLVLVGKGVDASTGGETVFVGERID